MRRLTTRLVCETRHIAREGDSVDRDSYAPRIRPCAFGTSQAYTTARGLYYQRCGFPGGLQAPHASPRHVRPQCHEHDGSASDDGESFGAVYAADLLNSPLYNGEKVDGETMIDTHGGWHDAGDYGKYIMTAAEAIKDLVDGFDIDPSK